MHRNKKLWTDAEIELLKALRARGVVDKVTAHKLGRSVDAIRGMASKLDLKRRVRHGKRRPRRLTLRLGKDEWAALDRQRIECGVLPAVWARNVLNEALRGEVRSSMLEC